MIYFFYILLVFEWEIWRDLCVVTFWWGRSIGGVLCQLFRWLSLRLLYFAGGCVLRRWLLIFAAFFRCLLRRRLILLLFLLFDARGDVSIFGQRGGRARLRGRGTAVFQNAHQGGTVARLFVLLRQLGFVQQTNIQKSYENNKL